jgi:hypothetical protein
VKPPCGTVIASVPMKDGDGSRANAVVGMVGGGTGGVGAAGDRGNSGATELKSLISD